MGGVKHPMLNAVLWNVPLTAGLAVVLAALCRFPALHRRPALRHLLWLLLIAKLVTPPLIGIPLLPVREPSINVAATANLPSDPTRLFESTTYRSLQGNSTADNGPERALDGATLPSTQKRMDVPFYSGLVALSLLGTFVLSAVYGLRAVRLCRWLKRAGVQDPALAAACADVAASLRIQEAVRSCVVDVRWTPLLWAWAQPLVVMPRELMDDLNPQQLRGIVAHELAHYVRRDHWTNAFVFFVKVLLWWNPVVWWADREQRAAQELCCDAIAIDRCNASRRSYARTLLRALDFVQPESLTACVIAPGMGSRVSILRRFEMIGETQLSYRLPRWTPWLLLVSVILLLCFPVRGQDKEAADPANVPATAAGPDRTTNSPESPSGIRKIVSKIAERFVQQRPKTLWGKRPRGNCTISGKVVSAENGAPVDHARMYLFYVKTYDAIFVNTESDGSFDFEDIPKGPFSLKLSKTAGYQDVSYDPEGKSGQFPQFTLEQGEHRSGIVLKAERANRITGKILDKTGDVPKNINTFSVLAWAKQDNGKVFEARHGFVNPANGSYSIDGLSDKPVYVMARSWQNERQGEGYPAIYAPSTFFRDDAKLITFDKSRNVDGIDITLRKTGGQVLEGTVRDENGEPVPEAFLVAHHRDMLFDRVTAYSDAQGHYKLQGLGDGEVLVHVDAMHRGFVRTHAPIALDRTTPTVRRDFTLHRGALISGKLVDQDGNGWQIGKSHGKAYVTEDVKKHLKKLEPNSIPSWSGLPNKYGVQGIDGSSAVLYIPGEGDYYRSEMVFPTRNTFVFPSIKPGHALITFSPQEEGKRVIKILHNGQDIMKTGIETKAGQKIEDVQIVIGKR